MTELEIVSFETARQLQELGYVADATYGQHLWYETRVEVRPEIEEEYGSLSDDGYYELTEEGGGSLKWEEVYGESIRLTQFPLWLGKEIPAPTIYEAAKFIRNKFGIHISPMYEGVDKWEWDYYILKNNEKRRTAEYFKTYEEAYADAVKTLVASIHQIETEGKEDE